MIGEFFEAVRTGDAAKVGELLKSDPDLVKTKSKKGLSATMIAMYYGQEEVAEILLAESPELDIFEASVVGKPERVTELIKRDPNLVDSYSPDGFTPLGLAAFSGHKEIVEILLSKGARVNPPIRNEMSYTPLTGAVAHGHRGITEILLAKGADVNHRYSHGLTPLGEAAHIGDSEIVKVLLINGADVNPKMDDGRTPLALALEESHSKVAGMLRRHGGTQ
ncbi:MAG: ankyrin repeat domain-containing protein [Candidatus Geothermarchaeales archaeon]